MEFIQTIGNAIRDSGWLGAVVVLTLLTWLVLAPWLKKRKTGLAAELRSNLAALLEGLGGANTAVLSECPAAERNKYAALGTINLALSALAGWLVYAWQEFLPTDLVPPNTRFLYAFLAASLALGILFAASRVLSMLQLGSAAYIIGGFLLLPITGLFGGVVYFLWMFGGSKAEALTFAGLSAWALLAIVLVRTAWQSPVYDGVLLVQRA
jgi:hypothetical protein